MSYHSVSQTARILGVSRQSVSSRVQRKVIESHEIGGVKFIDDTEIARLQTPAEVARREKFKGKR